MTNCLFITPFCSIPCSSRGQEFRLSLQFVVRFFTGFLKNPVVAGPPAAPAWQQGHLWLSRNITKGWKGTQGAAKPAVRLHQARRAAATLQPGFVELIWYWKVPGDGKSDCQKGQVSLQTECSLRYLQGLSPRA